MKPKSTEKSEVQMIVEEKQAGEVVSLDKFRKRSK
jgi:hypothetical protein